MVNSSSAFSGLRIGLRSKSHAASGEEFVEEFEELATLGR
jgi:hypothetical protein